MLTAPTMDGRSVGNGDGGVKEIVVYVCWGGVLHDGMNGLMTYVGGDTRCMWVSQEMGVADIWKLLEGVMGVAIMGKKVWYTMKFDRRLLMPFETDGDVVNMMRDNDGHAYVYVSEVGRPFTLPLQVSDEQTQAEPEAVVQEGVEIAGSREGSLELVRNGDVGAAPPKLGR